jgi:hypothetical protein
MATKGHNLQGRVGLGLDPADVRRKNFFPQDVYGRKCNASFTSMRSGVGGPFAIREEYFMPYLAVFLVRRERSSDGRPRVSC